MEYEWNRPELPESAKGAGLAVGWMGLVLGFMIVVVGAAALGDPYSPTSVGIPSIALIYFGGACVSLGFVMVPVCLVLREIRRSAFEAALRAGEATEKKRPGA